jgi:two-component system LytT family response regulator
MKTIIIEDVHYEAELLKSLLKKHFPHIEILGVVDNVEESVKLISSMKPDFLLMDIEIMGGGTSYDILDQLQQQQIPMDFEIIFMTGHLNFDYPTMGYSYSALDFLKKPIEIEALKKAVNKAIQRNNPAQYLEQIQLLMDWVRSADNTATRLTVHKVGGIIEFVEIKDILYLEADREVTNFVLKDGKEIKAARNLGQYDKLLINHHRFFPISNSILIKLDEMKTYDHSERKLTMSNGKQLYASRRDGQDLRKYINENIELNPTKSFFKAFKNLFLGKK